MTNACVARFSGIHKAALPLPQRRKFGIEFIRNYSTCASPFVCSSTPLLYPPSSFVLNAQLAASDAPQRSDEWFALRKDRLTTSTFSTALGFWKGNRRYELWHEKVYAPDVQVTEGTKKGAMEWGVLNEAAAIDRYKSITGRDVSSLGFAIHSEERFDWIGASPDGLLGCFPGGGILEVKCPFNKGKPETMLPWSTLPFYYMPQVQGQMEESCLANARKLKKKGIRNSGNIKKKMDIYNSNGLSWADQWDPEPLPSEREYEKKGKHGSDKTKSMKKFSASNG
ncbi:UNVERIFIED_CONTAM: hypothetical protein Scaly_1466700 [Sesamum calycinum]|uniref:YqaJ viral recombinase domain-containing protein n=1 Tax=Sesamum calycinum TaxID=2727403 RepID=A0AAW2PNL7_9LAMI